MRLPHYWKRIATTSAPASVLALDTEARPQAGRLAWRLGCGLAFRLEAGRRTRQSQVVAATPMELWRFIHSRLAKDRPLHVIGHNLAFDLAIMGAWRWLASSEFECRRAVLSDGCLSIRGRLAGKPILFLDTFNWWKAPLAAIGDELGLPKLEMPPQDADDEDWAAYCMRDAEIAALAFQEAIALVRSRDLGPFRATVAGQSFTALCRQWLRHDVLVHCDTDALALERASYYGGIVEAAFIGKAMGGPFWELDVQSMYPALCREELPVRLAGYSPSIGPDALRNLMGQHLATADVDISTYARPYPVRIGRRVLHAVGQFRTVLPDPELRAALAEGSVTRVHRACWHWPAPALRQAMDSLLAMRQEFRESGQPARASLAKAMANSLYGKTAQRNIGWMRWGPEAMAALEEMHGAPPGTLDALAGSPPRCGPAEVSYWFCRLGAFGRVRNFWGYVEVQVDRGESRDSVPSIAAHVASLGRCQLRSIQAAAGLGNWFYSDTDSIWVNRAGLEGLQAWGWVEAGVPGKLSIRRESPLLQIHGPKDYRIKGRRVVKGAKDDARWVNGFTYLQEAFPGPAALMGDREQPGVQVRTIRRRLRRRLDGCHVGDDGWTRHLELPADRP